MVNGDQSKPPASPSDDPAPAASAGGSPPAKGDVTGEAARQGRRVFVPPHATSIKTLRGSKPKHRFGASSMVLLSIGAAVIWLIVIFILEDRWPCSAMELASSPKQCISEVVTLRHWSWLIGFAIVAAFMFGLGHQITGNWKSLLIDDRNKISLSRLQVVLWTLVVLSALANALAWNLVQDVCIPRENDPLDRCESLDFSIPQDLLLLMGVSSGALIGAHLIKAQQLSKHKLAVNHSHHHARWTDIFETEGEDDTSAVDLGKIQMFLFTLILVLVYAAVVAAEFAEPDNFAFPDFPEVAIVLLGISQISYLATKAAQN